VDSKADESKDPSEAVPEPAAEDSESRKSSETLDQVVFKDTDDDVILLQLDGDRVREFVNGELELEQVELFEIDVAQREYKDDSGRGKFQDEEDVTKIQQQVAGLFARAAKAALLKPARVKNYTKPNILLLGPTGSGKTYLLRNLADLIGVPFVKADATKFTETGYVGRDADEVMGELLQAADGDVELAQVGIVYVDEIDKVCSEGDGRTSSFRRATQALVGREAFSAASEETRASSCQQGTCCLSSPAPLASSTRSSRRSTCAMPRASASRAMPARSRRR